MSFKIVHMRLQPTSNYYFILHYTVSTVLCSKICYVYIFSLVIVYYLFYCNLCTLISNTLRFFYDVSYEKSNCSLSTKISAQDFIKIWDFPAERDQSILEHWTNIYFYKHLKTSIKYWSVWGDTYSLQFQIFLIFSV